MRWLAVVVLVVACKRPVTEPVTPPPPDARIEEPAPIDAPVRAGFLRTRFVKIDVIGADLVGTLPVGSEHGVAMDWTGCLLQASSDRCHPFGELVILRVEPRLTRARLRALETEVVIANPFVELRAPP